MSLRPKIYLATITFTQLDFVCDSLSRILSRSMASFPELTGQGVPPDGNPRLFLAVGNVGVQYITTLSLPGLTIGLPVWLFSNSMVSSVVTPVPPPPPPPEQHHVDSKVDPFPSSPIAASSSSTSPGETVDFTNQVAKKKKKKTNTKKSPKGKVASTTKISEVEPPSAPPRKVKSPC